MDTDFQDIAARVRIRDLYSRYCFALDAKDANGLADCFTEDGAFVNEHGEFVGREAVNRLLLPAPETHYSINVEVMERSEGTYMARACFLLLHAGESRVAAHGLYDDTVRQGVRRGLAVRPSKGRLPMDERRLCRSPGKAEQCVRDSPHLPIPIGAATS